MTSINPFRYGALALDEAFTDREAEIAELKADVRNGQDVVIFAPRRYGKSSLVWRASQELAREKTLVAQVDLMTAPTPATFAEKLARTIHDDVASPLLRAKERLRVFGDLKVTPSDLDRPADRRRLVLLRRRRAPRGHPRHDRAPARAAGRAGRGPQAARSCSCSTSSRRSWRSTAACRT